MNYHFFDYKKNISGFSSDMFSTWHIIFIVACFVIVPIACFFLRKTSHKKVDLFLKIFSIVFVLWEIIKITWESYYDITIGDGFNVGGILPIYTCSLSIYTALCAGWGKGEIKEYSLAFLTTISLLSGAVGIVYCNGLNFYPFWTFGAFYSLFFHLSMFAVGMFLLFTGYKKLEWSDIIKGWIPMLLLSVVAIPVDYEYHADYMQLYEGSGVPLMSTLAEKLASVKLRFIFTIVMLLMYIPFGAIVVCISKLVYKIKDNSKSKVLQQEEKL